MQGISFLTTRWGIARFHDLQEFWVNSRCRPHPHRPYRTETSSEHYGPERQCKVQARTQETLRSCTTKSTKRKAGGSTFDFFASVFQTQQDLLRLYFPTFPFNPSYSLSNTSALIVAGRCVLIALAVPSTPCSHVPQPISRICFTAHPLFLPHRIRIIKP